MERPGPTLVALHGKRESRRTRAGRLLLGEAETSQATRRGSHPTLVPLSKGQVRQLFAGRPLHSLPRRTTRMRLMADQQTQGTAKGTPKAKSAVRSPRSE